MLPRLQARFRGPHARCFLPSDVAFPAQTLRALRHRSTQEPTPRPTEKSCASLCEASQQLAEHHVQSITSSSHCAPCSRRRLMEMNDTRPNDHGRSRDDQADSLSPDLRIHGLVMSRFPKLSESLASRLTASVVDRARRLEEQRRQVEASLPAARALQHESGVGECVECDAEPPGESDTPDTSTSLDSVVDTGASIVGEGCPYPVDPLCSPDDKTWRCNWCYRELGTDGLDRHSWR